MEGVQWEAKPVRLFLNDSLTAWSWVDEVDFAWACLHVWAFHSDQRGRPYARRLHYRSPIYLHRAVMLKSIGKPPSEAHIYVDHINGHSLDNRRANLRWATAAQNAANVWKGVTALQTRSASIFEPPKLIDEARMLQFNTRKDPK